MKKYIYIIVAIVVIALIGLTLYNNKKEINQEAKLSEITVEAYPVQVDTVGLMDIKTSFKAVGTLQPYKDLTLISQTQGQVEALYKEQGDQVKAGTILAKVDDELIRSELMVAEANYNNAQKDLQRFRNLQKGGAVTPQQVEQIELKVTNAKAKYQAAKKRLNDTSIKSPISGVINQLFIEKGSIIGPGTPVGEIVDVSKLKLRVKIAEGEVLRVKEGGKVNVRIDRYPNEQYIGKVKHISVKPDPSLQYTVEIEVINKGDTALKAGMYATAQFISEAATSGLIIDRKAILGSLKNAQVFVIKNGQAVKKEVTTGTEINGKVEIIAGLDNGDLVVTTGQINLKDGTRVRVVN